MSGLWVLIGLIGLVVNIVQRIKKDNQRRMSQTPAEGTTAPEQTPNQQSAYEWIFGSQPTSTEGTDDEDWIRPVQSTLHNDLHELQETAYEIVHESAHEPLHVRRSHQEEPQEPQGGHPIQLNRHTLNQALLLREALDAPRSRKPWSPHKR